MVKIRKGSFETNSSSMHSFTMKKKCKQVVGPEWLDMPRKDGVITIVLDGEYGWGNEKIEDQIRRAQYCLQQKSDEREEICDYIRDMLNDSGIFDEDIKEVKYEETDSGYIDHQSCGWPVELDYKDFIFSSEGILYISNDNDGWDEMDEDARQPLSKDYESYSFG